MTLEAAIITHRLMPGSVFTRPGSPKYMIIGGAVGMIDPYSLGGICHSGMEAQVFFVNSSWYSDNWEVIPCD